MGAPPRGREGGKVKRDVLRESKASVVAVYTTKAYREIRGRTPFMLKVLKPSG